MRPDPDAHTRELAAKAPIDPTGWFEELYAEAADGRATVPWDRGEPAALLAEWARGLDGTGKRALVVGCGLGRDSEFIASLGFDTVAFDVSATAIATTKARHPDSTVDYVTADLLNPPGHWRRAFDLVVEDMTVQSLPDPPRAQAIANIPPLVGPGGTLVVVAAANLTGAATDGPPWPLVRAEIDAFAVDGLQAGLVECLPDVTDPAIHRWRATFTRRR